jgi:peroxiredoxin
VTGLTTSRATIGWTTDEPATSLVNYGQTAEDYSESTDVDSTLKTSHSVTLTGLLSNTGYHFQVVSEDAIGTGASSNDNTFLTVSAETLSPSDLAPILTSTPIPIKAVPTEKQPPTINLTTTFANPYKEPPQISGTASDNEALAGIFYSIDGGENWQLVDVATGLGSKKASFSFKPQSLEDGNYEILARAVDTSGNISVTPSSTMVIDRLPPRVGGSVISIGAQTATRSQNGGMVILAGIDQKITLGATGGPTTIQLRVKSTKEKAGKKEEPIFSLSRSPDSGLWSGIVSAQKPGQYQLIADALDGAGNRTQREITSMQVLEAPKLVEKGSKRPISGTMTVFYREPLTNIWVKWDGQSFGQVNPQPIKNDGIYRFILPPGRYYFEVKAAAHQTLTSRIFTLQETTPLTQSLELHRQIGIGGLRLPSLMPRAERLKFKSDSLNTLHPLVGKKLPTFELPDTSDKLVNSSSLVGQPGVITVFSLWSPEARTQLPILAQLQKNHPNIAIMPVASLENAGRLQAYSAVSAYSFKSLVDKDGVLIEPYFLRSLPTHYFIDRNGTVKNVIISVLSQGELLEEFASL